MTYLKGAAGRAAYAAARKPARRKAADPQTVLSAPVPVTPRRTLCICGDDGPCWCAEHLAGAWPPPAEYEDARLLAFRQRHPD